MLHDCSPRDEKAGVIVTIIIFLTITCINRDIHNVCLYTCKESVHTDNSQAHSVWTETHSHTFSAQGQKGSYEGDTRHTSLNLCTDLHMGQKICVTKQPQISQWIYVDMQRKTMICIYTSAHRVTLQRC